MTVLRLFTFYSSEFSLPSVGRLSTVSCSRAEEREETSDTSLRNLVVFDCVVVSVDKQEKRKTSLTIEHLNTQTQSEKIVLWVGFNF